MLRLFWSVTGRPIASNRKRNASKVAAIALLFTSFVLLRMQPLLVCMNANSNGLFDSNLFCSSFIAPTSHYYLIMITFVIITTIAIFLRNTKLNFNYPTEMALKFQIKMTLKWNCTRWTPRKIHSETHKIKQKKNSFFHENLHSKIIYLWLISILKRTFNSTILFRNICNIFPMDWRVIRNGCQTFCLCFLAWSCQP